MMMMMLTRTVKMFSPASSAAVLLHVCCCWIFLLPGTFGQASAVDSGSLCKETDFSGKNRITLCHNASASTHLSDMKCTKKSEGFVLMPLVLAPLSNFEDCSRHFNLVNLYAAQCMRNLTDRQDVYDRNVFHILDRVSGQNRITPDTVVDRFPMSVRQKDGDLQKDSSAFIAFKEVCKPAIEDPKQNHMINPCSNQTVQNNLVFFTMRGAPTLPDTPSMCRCVLQPKSKLELTALDLRLQNILGDPAPVCGQSSLKIESNRTREDIQCHKMRALYGSHELYISPTSEEVLLTLTYISKEEAPTSLWLQAEDEFQFDGKQMSVTCDGLIPLPTEPPAKKNNVNNGDGHDGGDGDGDGGGGGGSGGGVGDGADGKQIPEPANAGMDMQTILIAVIGVLVGLILLVVILLGIIKRRRGGSFPIPPCCRRCCSADDDDDDPIFYKPVTQLEPVYAEPGRPRPSTTTPPYTFPADAKLPAGGSAIYAEPDPNGTLGLTLRSRLTPPPIPEQPPPSSPPAFIPPTTPPPKPERTLLRARKESVNSNGLAGGGQEEVVGGEEEEADYDHIVTGGKTPLKSPRGGRDGQNNIIGGADEDGMMEAVNNVYDCLRHGDDYSQMLNNHKKQVKDNV